MSTFHRISTTFTALGLALPRRSLIALAATTLSILAVGNPCLAQPVWVFVPLPPMGSPPARLGHRMAYDSAFGKTVLFGGLDPFGAPLR